MNIGFADVLKAFLEVGLLGLCAVMVIIIFYENYKKGSKVDDQKNKFFANNFEKLSNKLDGVYSKIQEQNNKFFEMQEQHYIEEKKQNAELVQAIIYGVTSHVPSVEETDKLTEISKKIDLALHSIRKETGANRAYLIQYHNGGKGLNQQAFLKMSMTNEDVASNTKPAITEFKDQFRSSLGYFVNTINEENKCYIDNLEDIKTKDIGVYEFMKLRNVTGIYGYAVRGAQNNVIAFIGLEYIGGVKANIKVIDKVFKENHKIFDTLLNE